MQSDNPNYEEHVIRDSRACKKQVSRCKLLNYVRASRYAHLLGQCIRYQSEHVPNFQREECRIVLLGH